MSEGPVPHANRHVASVIPVQVALPRPLFIIMRMAYTMKLIGSLAQRYEEQARSLYH